MQQPFTDTTTGIAQVIATWENKLTNLPAEVITNRRNKQHRTIKQILGHLVDSASNNQQRMVRLQYNTPELVFSDYRQDNDRWIAIQNYQEANWHNLVQLWKFYNLHIIQIIQQVDQSKLQNYWRNFEGNPVTLHQMITNYLTHLILHINEMEELITQPVFSKLIF